MTLPTPAIRAARLLSLARPATMVIALLIATMVAGAMPGGASAATHASSGRHTSSSAFIVRVQLESVGTHRCLQADPSGRVSTTAPSDCNGSNYQWWDYNSDLGALRNVATGACLDGNESGAVYAGACNNANYQSWIVIESTPAWFYVQNRATLRYLDGNESGAVYTSIFNGANYQAWFFNTL